MRALLEAHADPTLRTADSPLGDPLATAQRHGLAAIESLLRDATRKWLRTHAGTPASLAFPLICGHAHTAHRSEHSGG